MPTPTGVGIPPVNLEEHVHEDAEKEEHKERLVCNEPDVSEKELSSERSDVMML